MMKYCCVPVLTTICGEITPSGAHVERGAVMFVLVLSGPPAGLHETLTVPLPLSTMLTVIGGWAVKYDTDKPIVKSELVRLLCLSSTARTLSPLTSGARFGKSNTS